MYLRIADELYMKRCLVGGIDRVYEIAKDFRNEGLSRFHNPEFTMAEWYEAYADYEDMLRGTEEMLVGLVHQLLGSAVLERQGHALSFARPLARRTFHELMELLGAANRFQDSAIKLPKGIHELQISAAPLASTKRF